MSLPKHPGTGTSGRRTELRAVSRAHPCVICDGDHKCSTGADGLIVCGRTDHPVPGFVHLGPAERDPMFHLFRPEDHSMTGRKARRSVNTVRQAGSSTRGPDWDQLADGYAAALDPGHRDELATLLGLPVDALDRLDGLGYCGREGCWTFPERDPRGAVVGITRRYPDGGKKMMRGGQRGLTLPAGWQDRPGPVFLVEGASDVLALTAVGLAAVGRPNNTGGTDWLAELLTGLPPDRQVVVVGENDAKADGSWPGRDGAESTASRLGELLSRAVGVTLPPSGYKDVRAWVCTLIASASPAEARRRVHDTLAATTTFSQTPSASPIATTCVDDIQIRPVEWLVPGYIPAGKLTLIAGEGGQGKSALTLDLTACLTAGRPAFGLPYDPPPPGRVLLVSLEDDFGDTVVPRLLAAGADLGRIDRLDHVRDSKGKATPFSLTHVDELRAHLRRHACCLVVVDPVSCFVGRAGVDDHKTAQLRAVLDPLAELAAASGTAFLLVTHLNKATDASATHRVMGSTAYVAAARMAFMVAPNPGDVTVRLLTPIKANLSGNRLAIPFAFTPLPQDGWSPELTAKASGLSEEVRQKLAGQLFRLQWREPVEPASNTLAGSGSGTKQSKQKECEKFILEWVTKQGQAVPVIELEAAAEAAEFEPQSGTYKRAKAVLSDKKLIEVDKKENKFWVMPGWWKAGRYLRKELESGPKKQFVLIRQAEDKFDMKQLYEAARALDIVEFEDEASNGKAYKYWKLPDTSEDSVAPQDGPVDPWTGGPMDRSPDGSGPPVQESTSPEAIDQYALLDSFGGEYDPALGSQEAQDD